MSPLQILLHLTEIAGHLGPQLPLLFPSLLHFAMDNAQSSVLLTLLLHFLKELIASLPLRHHLLSVIPILQIAASNSPGVFINVCDLVCMLVAQIAGMDREPLGNPAVFTLANSFFALGGMNSPRLVFPESPLPPRESVLPEDEGIVFPAKEGRKKGQNPRENWNVPSSAGRWWKWRNRGSAPPLPFLFRGSGLDAGVSTMGQIAFHLLDDCSLRLAANRQTHAVLAQLKAIVETGET